MSVTFIDDLPGLADSTYPLSLRTHNSSAFLRSPEFIARICLETGKVQWLVERRLAKLATPVWHQPRRIQLWGSDFWISKIDDVIVEISSTECGGLMVSARHATTGKQRWEHFIQIPNAAVWAEKTPAWPGAQTEEIYGFIADDPKWLTVCLFRQTRRSGYSNPNLGIRVFDLPLYACQTDAAGFDPSTGKVGWHASFDDVRIGIMERSSFTGIWSNSPKVGVLDFEKGSNTILYESPNQLGWPVLNGPGVAVPWRSKADVGVDWIDRRGNRTRKATWRRPGVKTNQLHATQSGLALQTNDQTLWWLGDEDMPLWNIRAKPYIYQVYSVAKSGVFVGTDGNGGRLLGFDNASGREILNLKPALGGVGDLSKVPGHDVLVATFRISRSYSVAACLLVLSMKDRQHDLSVRCRSMVGPWEHGAVCRAGNKGERLAIVDVRTIGAEEMQL